MYRLILLLIFIASTSLIHAQENTLILQHEGVVTASSWNTDETQILTASEDGTVRVWDAATGEELAQLDHASPVRGAIWNNDSTRVLSWSQDGAVIMWDAISHEKITSFAHDDNVLGAAWNADETQVLSWSMDQTARVWNIETGEAIILPHASTVLQGTWQSDHIHTFEENGTVHIWDTDGEEVLNWSLSDVTLGVSWSEDESRLLAWTADNNLIILDAESRRIADTFNHGTFVEGGAWSDDESRVMSWSADDTVRVWDITAGREVMRLQHNDWVNGAIWNRDESLILSWSHTRVWLWGVDGELVTQLQHDNLVNGAIWNEDETKILSWGWDYTARVWDL